MKLPLKYLLYELAYWAGLVGNGPVPRILSSRLDLFMKKLIRDRPNYFLGPGLAHFLLLSPGGSTLP